MNKSQLTIRENVVKYLRNSILTGAYKPRQRIIESDISRKFNISRGPVREAICQLEQEGLLEYERNKGRRVKILSPDEAWEIYLIRSDLESLSIKILNGKIGEPYLRNMRKAVHEMEFYVDEMNILKLVEVDQAFHSQIIKASKMKRIESLWTSLNGTSFAIFLTVARLQQENVKKMTAAHQRVLEVIQQGDVEKSCAEINKHYLSTGRILYSKVTQVAER